MLRQEPSISNISNILGQLPSEEHQHQQQVEKQDGLAVEDNRLDAAAEFAKSSHAGLNAGQRRQY